MANQQEIIDIMNKVVSLPNGGSEIVVTKIKKVYHCGILSEVMYLNDKDQLHREGEEPAYIVYCEGNDKVKLEIWSLNDEMYRKIEYNARSIKYKEMWYKDGKMHRDGDLPAYIIYNEKGTFPRDLIWYQHGKIHREEDLPSIEWYNDIKGYVYYRSWCKNDVYYRENDLPTVEKYNEQGIVTSQEWHSEDGKFHREGGPALIQYSSDGKSILNKKWYKNNIEYKPSSVNGNAIENINENADLIDKIKKFDRKDLEKCLAILEIINTK